ncbi:MAG TPA: ATP-binding protein [Dehalococcoidia bacterium]|nr:ATP-binding protein [Dehalococcoidia bacterium]
MLGSLRARLIVSFALVVALAVFLAGAGALFLLRDREQAAARERYGRFAEPVNAQIANMVAHGQPLGDMRAAMAVYADQLDVRVLLLNDDLQVIYDSDAAKLEGRYVLSFENRRLAVAEAGNQHYTWADYHGGDVHLTLFAPPGATQEMAQASDGQAYEALIAIPASQLSSAWLDLAPRLALAGAIALAVSFGVSYFISRSISRPLGRITEASVEMSRGNYDVYIPIRGEDEVGRLSEAFNAMARQVSSSQQTMRDLLANVSHELKTPLTSIQGFSQAIIDGAVTTEEDLQESGRIIHEEANRMRALVDDLLLLSQIESGQMVMQHAHVDLRALLEATVERFQWALRDAEVSAHLDFGSMPPVHGDERRLEQVFTNLITNAVRHTPRGGVITVRAGADLGGVVVSVHNTGSLIPAEDLPRVFERFFQVDRARARKPGSSGLGLAIVAEIVEAHGGTVKALSSPGHGTEFVVTLPGTTMPEQRSGRAPAKDDARATRRPRKEGRGVRNQSGVAPP